MFAIALSPNRLSAADTPAVVGTHMVAAEGFSRAAAQQELAMLLRQKPLFSSWPLEVRDSRRHISFE